jgi:hypothetical protein
MKGKRAAEKRERGKGIRNLFPLSCPKESGNRKRKLF